MRDHPFSRAVSRFFGHLRAELYHLDRFYPRGFLFLAGGAATADAELGVERALEYLREQYEPSNHGPATFSSRESNPDRNEDPRCLSTHRSMNLLRPARKEKGSPNNSKAKSPSVSAVPSEITFPGLNRRYPTSPSITNDAAGLDGLRKDL